MPDVAHNLIAWKLLASLKAGKGFQRVAIDLDMDVPACSRLIKRLEVALGVPLINHRTRPVTLTDEALGMLPAVEALIAAHERLLLEAGNVGNQPLSVTFGIPINVPKSGLFKSIDRYREIDPALAFTLAADVNHEDVLQGRAEIAYLPYRPLEDGLIVWDIGRAANCMVASPAYLKKYGAPTSPEALAYHRLLLRDGRNYPATTVLTNGKETVPLRYEEVAVKGDVLSIKEALALGRGIAVDLSFSGVREGLESGDLVPILTDWHRPEWELCLVMSERSAAQKRLVDFCRWLLPREREDLRVRTTALKTFLGR